MSRLVLFLILLAASCVGPQPQEPSTPAVWTPIITKINSLRHATQPEWRAAAEFEEVVRNRKDLERVVDGLALDDLTEVEAVALYQRSRVVAHYGFKANFHALVFFGPSGRPLRVLR